MEQKQQLLKTGTTTVGVVCKEGVILAADRRATMGNYIADKHAQKVHPIAEYMALTTAGSVSDIQLLAKLIKAEIKLKEVRVNRKPNVKETANLISGMIYENIRRPSMIPSIAHFLLGGFDESGAHLYDLFVDGSLTECDDFVSSGSGSVIAYGVLETLYKKDITLKEGVSLAIKAVNAAIQRDSASGNGVDVITITKSGLKYAFQKEIDSTITE